MGPLPDDFDIVSTGWIRFLPEPGVSAYLAIWGLNRHPDGPVTGDLDDLGAEAFDVATYGGFDAVYDPAKHGDAVLEDDEEPLWTSRWSEFGEQAAKRGLPMRTARDLIEFMREVGLVERLELDGEISWRPVVPVPLAEDILELDVETRDREAKIRWEEAFQRANNRVTSWLVDQRTDAATTDLTVTLTELAGQVELDVEELRHGLAAAMNEAGDIAVTPHPEQAEPDQPLHIVVDWELFDTKRIAIRLADPEV
jgi:hypothetical protein